MNEAAFRQKIIDLRMEMIQNRIESEKNKNVLALMDRRERALTEALKEIRDICNNFDRCVTRGMVLEIANKAINAD